MTTIDIEKLEAGPETDVLVAEAIGSVFSSMPRFSTDWNAAMSAAERVGLFTEYQCVLNHHADGWSVDGYEACDGAVYGYDDVDRYEHYMMFEPHEFDVSSTTGALAICKAILALSESNVG